MIRVSELPNFDLSAHLSTAEDVTEYLSQVLEDGDTDELLRALGYIAKAQGMSQVAERSGLGRESLYKALEPGASRALTPSCASSAPWVFACKRPELNHELPRLDRPIETGFP
jgi:probable addiction module antidote protein